MSSDVVDVTADHHRPTFHFLPPRNWMNDPNGLIQWQGAYHLFYQHNPNGAFWGTMHWGHAMSEDLVHWKHMPIALAPSADGPDADGVFSGCAVDVHGAATLMYTAVRGDDQLPCIATSHDDNLASWTKSDRNPVIPGPPEELQTTIFRDHSVWREDGHWYQVIGSGIEGKGGTALVYRSPDFEEWEFVGSLVDVDALKTDIGRDATGWECPDFFRSGDSYVLTVSMWDRHPLRVGYFTGTYENNRFIPEHEGLVDPGASFYAPQSFSDDSGRRIMFGWLKESRSEEAHRRAGWAGVMSLPRELTVLDDGSLGTAPVAEIAELRNAHLRISGDRVANGELLPLGDIRGNAIELLVHVGSGTRDTVTIDVLCSRDGRESTSIVLDRERKTLALDTRRSSESADMDGGYYSLEDERCGDGPIALRVYVDHSVVEVFLNDERCITGRAYPAAVDASGVRVVTNDEAASVESIDVWSMESSIDDASGDRQ